MQPLNATQIKSLYSDAMRLMTKGAFDEALQTLRRIVEANPKIAEPHFQVGRILIETHRASLAFKPFQAAAQLKPAELAIWRGWAEAVALGGDGEAESNFLAALKTSPLKPEAKIALQDRFGAQKKSTRPLAGGLQGPQLQKLVRLMGERRFADAERLGSKLVRDHPQSALGLNILASAEAAQGKVKDAIAHYQRAVQIDPGYAEAHDNLGRLLMDHNRLEEAITSFRKAVVHTPYLVSALVNLGVCYARNWQAAAAIPVLERAVAAEPEAAIALVALGNAQTRLRNYAQAEAILLRAIKLPTGETGEAYALLAQAQARLGKDDEAMAHYDRALSLDTDSAAATGGKAALLQTLGQFDEAEALFRRGFELDPTNGENYRLFTASHKAKEDDPVIGQMLRQFEEPSLTAIDRMNLGFAIAKSLEDIKDYSRVFRYLDEANAIMRSTFPYDIAQRRREVDLVKTAMSGVDWPAISIPDTTDFAPIFVTGMPRSGTTLVEQIIASHSTVNGAGETGEATRRAQRLVVAGDSAHRVRDMAAPEIAALGRDYAEVMQARFPDIPRITDKSIQTYMYIGLLKLAMPNARFIVVRRDPRDNLLSMYKNKFPDGTHLYAYDQRDLAVLYDTFVEMIDFWREEVPDWFYEVQYEELVGNPEEETRKLIAAAGLDWEDACLNFHENKRKVETLSVFQVRQPMSKGSVKSWQRYEADLAPMLEALKESGHVAD